MSEFIRPQVQVEEIDATSARVSVEPLERGYGDTLGNSLRRVLLSSLEGAAVEAIQIDGAQHEFMTIPNMVEDVTDIVLNVKGLVFRTLGTSAGEGTATISVDGPCEVTGADFFIPSEFELVNPEILSTEGEQRQMEGCLSVPGKRGVVARPAKVTVRALNRRGKPMEIVGEGFLAMALCHEIDHLDGVLYVDKIIEEVPEDAEE